jgi:hypothetical protein
VIAASVTGGEAAGKKIQKQNGDMHSTRSCSPCIPQTNLEMLPPHTASSLHLLAILKLYFLQFLPTTTISFPVSPFAFGIGREAGVEGRYFN